MADPTLGDTVHYVLAEGEERAATIAGNFWDGRAPLYVLPGTASEQPRFVHAAMDETTHTLGTFHLPADTTEAEAEPAPESPFIGTPDVPPAPEPEST